MALSIRCAEGPIGAEIRGANLALELDDDTFAAIRRTLDDRGVVVLREQRLAPADIVRFAGRFGRLLIHAHNKFALREQPAVSVISNVVEGGRNIGVPDAGLVWHTDGSYLIHPDMYSFLYALEVPLQDGVALGNTLYAGAASAYEALAGSLRSRLDGLRAVHSFAHHSVRRAAHGGTRIELTEELRRKVPDVSQPVVRTHPRTGRKGLYVTEGHTTHILGMEPGESAALLQMLWEHLRRPEFGYVHRWQVGDLLVWDNCATQHRATCDYALPQRRLMHRTATAGEEAVGVALGTDP